MSANSLKKATVCAVLALGILGASSAAQAQSNVKIGVLECSVAPGVGLIVGSSRSMDCVFRPNNGRVERYKGNVTRVGIDIGFTGRGTLAWGVFAPTSNAYKPGGLLGDYAGISAQATIGVGLGANALVGGSNRTFALQPFSVEGQTGLNIAAGVAGLSLR